MGCEGPLDLCEPGHTRVLQQVQTGATVASGGAALVDVELGPLAVELGFRDITAACGVSGRAFHSSEQGERYEQ